MFGKQHLLLFLLAGAVAIGGSVAFEPGTVPHRNVSPIPAETAPGDPGTGPLLANPAPASPAAGGLAIFPAGPTPLPSDPVTDQAQNAPAPPTGVDPAADRMIRPQAPMNPTRTPQGSDPQMPAALAAPVSISLPAPSWGSPPPAAAGANAAAPTDRRADAFPVRRHAADLNRSATESIPATPVPTPSDPGGSTPGRGGGAKAPGPPIADEGNGSGVSPGGTGEETPKPPPVDGGEGSAAPPGGNAIGTPTAPPVVEKPNTAPVARPGPDQAVMAGEAVALDAGGSQDADGDRLSFHWTLVSKPAGSGCDLSDAGAARPTFTPDLPGLYLFELIVNDGRADSLAQTVLIEVSERRATVPSVIGLDMADARSAILGAKLAVGKITVGAADAAQKNQVLGQNPAPGARVPEGSPVGLLIALPATADDDGDGLPDAWEYAAFGGLEHGGGDDPDRDGFTNRQEYLVGTDPADASDAPVPAGNYFEYDLFGRIVVKQIALEP